MWIMIFQLHMTSLLQVLRLVVCSQNITIHIGSDYIERNEYISFLKVLFAMMTNCKLFWDYLSCCNSVAYFQVLS